MNLILPKRAVDVAIVNSRAGRRAAQAPANHCSSSMHHRFTSETIEKYGRVLEGQITCNVTLKTGYLNREDGVEDDIPEFACGQTSF